MNTKRIIPCLDIKDGKVVKGVKFEDLQELDDPIALAEYYNATGADELVFYDITASAEDRSVAIELFKRVVASNSLPLTIGGNIKDISDFDRVLEAGANKVSISTGAINNPNLIDEAAKKYGSGVIVLAMDVRRIDDGNFRVFARGGRDDSGHNAADWAAECEKRGAGEIVLNSIDTDGVLQGFDLDMLANVAAAVKIPIIASGGAGNKEHFLELFNKIPDIDAGLAASIFHRKEVNIAELKLYLSENGIPVRLA